ncbi:kinesin-like protein, putative [Plasmodium ovale curtisi]|uniref:Kinesin-like protein, putative n=1 Tax=Plasmodium ovale curtisi TaxID=864141 RepID=A0A1A8VK15_PLAOA|nr:kinesin-like protein, putative [Plasmodium ovale curtisi]
MRPVRYCWRKEEELERLCSYAKETQISSVLDKKSKPQKHLHEERRSDEKSFARELKAEDRIDEKQGHKLENVVVRIRKLEKNEESSLHTDPNDKTTLYFNKDFSIEKYNFDMVFNENDNNEMIFKKIGGHLIVNNVCRGFKETVITYGQTGSGKTYTLFGSNKEYGIVYYFVYHLYKLCNFKNKKKTIYLSIYEILGDTLVDLISYQNEKSIEFYTEEYYLKTIRYPYKVVNIKNYETAKKIIDTACLLRNVEATSQNMRSSRSHAIIQFFVNISDSTRSNGIETVRDYYGVLTLVDLVGCEREEFNTTKKEKSKDDKTSTKILNSSLTSLNKMLRKMQMGNLDESDKRQSLTSSTLIMASECKKIKSKRKQLIYVKSENKDAFFKKIANDSGKAGRCHGEYEEGRWDQNTSKQNGKDGKDGTVGTDGERTREEKDDVSNNTTNASVIVVYANGERGNNVVNLSSEMGESEKYKSLKNIVREIIEEKGREEKKKNNLIQELKNDVVKLQKECAFWKRETHNYHNKLKVLNKNYIKMNEYLFNTLNNNSSNLCNSSFVKCENHTYGEWKSEHLAKKGNVLVHGGKYEQAKGGWRKDRQSNTEQGGCDIVHTPHNAKDSDQKQTRSHHSPDLFTSDGTYNADNGIADSLYEKMETDNYFKKKNTTGVYQIDDEYTLKREKSHNKLVPFDEKKKSEKECLLNNSPERKKYFRKVFTKELINYEQNSAHRENWEKENDTPEHVREQRNDKKKPIYEKKKNSTIDAYNEHDTVFKKKNCVSNFVEKRENNDLNSHQIVKNDVTVDIIRNKTNNSNEEPLLRNYQTNEDVDPSPYYNKMDTENVKRKNSEKGIIPTDELTMNNAEATKMGSTLNIPSKSATMNYAPKSEALHMIPSEHFNHRHNVTVESLATKIKNRILKSRSLSIAK